MRVMYYLIESITALPNLVCVKDDPTWTPRIGEWLLLDDKACEVTSIFYTPHGATEEAKYQSLLQVMTTPVEQAQAKTLAALAHERGH